MKTTAELRAQEIRIDKLMWHNSTRLIAQAHPATGGNHMLTNNWGNTEARKILDQFMERQHKLFHAFKRHYKEAFKIEYPKHLINRE